VDIRDGDSVALRRRDRDACRGRDVIGPVVIRGDAKSRGGDPAVTAHLNCRRATTAGRVSRRVHVSWRLTDHALTMR
jgi:hypothetical protein